MVEAWEDVVYREWAWSLEVRDVIDSWWGWELGYVFAGAAVGNGDAQREEKGDIISIESSNRVGRLDVEGEETGGVSMSAKGLEVSREDGEEKEKFSNIVVTVGV